MYTYNAKVVDVNNGDAVVVDIDLGFGVTSFYNLKIPIFLKQTISI